MSGQIRACFGMSSSSPQVRAVGQLHLRLDTPDGTQTLPVSFGVDKAATVTSIPHTQSFGGGHSLALTGSSFVHCLVWQSVSRGRDMSRCY